MTKLFEEAIEKVRQLPDPEQDVLARFILDEIQDERRWNNAFSRSPDVLERLAADAVKEHRSGGTRPLDPEAL